MKAVELKYAHASLYQRAQIITDIRPVFDSARERPVAAVISHTLQVTYMRGGEAQSVTMTLDEADVAQLIEQATAAKRKAASLLAFLGERMGGPLLFQLCEEQDQRLAKTIAAQLEDPAEGQEFKAALIAASERLRVHSGADRGSLRDALGRYWLRALPSDGPAIWAAIRRFGSLLEDDRANDLMSALDLTIRRACSKSPFKH